MPQLAASSWLQKHYAGRNLSLCQKPALTPLIHPVHSSLALFNLASQTGLTLSSMVCVCLCVCAVLKSSACPVIPSGESSQCQSNYSHCQLMLVEGRDPNLMQLFLNISSASSEPCQRKQSIQMKKKGQTKDNVLKNCDRLIGSVLLLTL